MLLRRSGNGINIIEHKPEMAQITYLGNCITLTYISSRKTLLKLGDPVVAGKCFFITDGSPTSGLFLISAFNSAITGEECYRAVLRLMNRFLNGIAPVIHKIFMALASAQLYHKPTSINRHNLE